MGGKKKKKRNFCSLTRRHDGVKLKQSASPPNILHSAPLKVSGPGLRRSGTRDGQVRVPQKRVGVPPSCQEAKGRLPERHPVHVEVWQDGGHVLPHSRLRRLGSRQRELPDTSQVGFRRTRLPRPRPLCYRLARISARQHNRGAEEILRCHSDKSAPSLLDLHLGGTSILVKLLPI